MQFIPTSLPEVILVVPKVFEDERGFFLESYQKERFLVQGYDVFNATRVEMIGMSDVKNQSVDVKNRWRQPGDQTNMPRAVFGSVS